MTDNDRNFNSSANIPSSPPPSDEGGHHFETNIPQGPKKERRGQFSADFDPRRDTVRRSAPGTSSGITEPESTPPRESAPVRREMPKRVPIDTAFEKKRLITLLVLMIPLAIFSFWFSLTDIVSAWWYQVDYGHGFFVIPLVALFLYLRLDHYPGTHYGLTWIGLAPILLCCFMRYFAASQYMDTLDQWSLFFWILGVVWFFYGTRVFLWALPSLGFLVFMFQLPWSFEVQMKNELQVFAARFASVLLQLMGEPAIPIKNTIRLSTMELGVEAACSGIRFLISVLAIAFATILLLRRPWPQNVLILLVAVPLALFINAARIAMTGILLLHFEGFLLTMVKPHRVGALADEIAGYVMIVVAVIMFFAFVWFLGKVFKRVTI